MATRVTTGGETRVTTSGAERVTVPDAPVVAAPTLTLPRDVRRSLTDVRLRLSEDGADLEIEEGDLGLEHGLVTAVLVSLFSDARAPTGDPLPDGEVSRRGWWAQDPDDNHGSLLWLLDREKVTATTIERLGAYARRALAWMVTEGLAARVEAEAVRIGTYEVELRVALHRGSARRWAGLWDGTDADPLFLSQLKVRILTL